MSAKYKGALTFINGIDTKRGITYEITGGMADFNKRTPKHEIDRLVAILTVSENPNGTEPSCALDPENKHAIFSTFRHRQELDVILDPEESLKGRVHILKAEMIKSEHENKGVGIDYRDTSTPPEWIIDKVKFGEPLPKGTEYVRIKFGLKGKEGPYEYNIFIHDDQGNAEGIPCDPQASNDPPKIEPPPA